MKTEPMKMTPKHIAAAGGGKFLNAKIDDIPDENRLADFCEIGPEDDSLKVVEACVHLVDPVRFVIGCRRRSADREADGHEDSLIGLTLEDCRNRMKRIAKGNS
jgi:hypothetical protein